MDLRLTGEQHQLVDTFASLYAREAPPERVRAAEPLGFDKALWELLTGLGIVTMARRASEHGWGASLLDLVLVAEQQGRAVAPVPVIETQVAARLLDAVGAPQGDGITTIALHPVAGGTATMVPAGAVATEMLVRDGHRLLRVPVGDDNRVVIENLGSMPVADVTITDAVCVADGVSGAWHAALDEYAVLTSAAVVGMAARALEITVDYTSHRHAWGQPIGAFQGVAHRLADCATTVDGARLLTWEAAWAEAEEPARFSELAAMAFGFASEAARDTTYWGVHLHGGYGFMLEYDVQLFWRRCRAWTRVLGSPADAYRLVADRRYGA